MKTYRYLYGTDLAGSYEEIFRSEGLTAYLRDQKHILSVSNKLEEIRGLYSFDKLNGYGQHRKKDIPLVVQYMPMPDQTMAVWGVGGAANAGNEGVWADLSNNTGRATTYTQLELFDLEEAAGTGNYTHLDILFGMEKLQDQDVVDARNGRRDMRANVRIEHVAPAMRQMDKEHVLAAAEALYAGKNVVFHLERGISFPYRSRELLMQLYSMLPPLFAKEIGYSCYCRADSVKDLTRHNFRVFVIPGEEALDPRDFPERQYLILDMSSRRNAGASEMWNVLERWWEMPWTERVEVMRWQFRDTDQLASTHSASKFISTSNTYQEKLRSFQAWKAQKTSVPTGITLEDLVDEYSRYKFWDDIPGAKETFAQWSKLVLGGEENLLDLTEKAFAELTMGTDETKQRRARRQYNLGSQLCSPRGSGLQKNIQRKIDSKVAAECALVVEQKNAEIQTLKEGHEAALLLKNKEISSLKSDHSAALREKDNEISGLIMKHAGDLLEKDTRINKLEEAHAQELGKKDQDIRDLNKSHADELQEKDNEITQLNHTHAQKLQEKDAEITQLNHTHAQELQEKDAKITQLNNEHEEKLGKLNEQIDSLNATLEKQTSHYTTQISDLNTKIRSMEESHAKEIAEKEEQAKVLRAEFNGLQVMLDGNNAAKRLDWLMNIPLLGLGVKALVDHHFSNESEETVQSETNDDMAESESTVTNTSESVSTDPEVTTFAPENADTVITDSGETQISHVGSEKVDDPPADEGAEAGSTTASSSEPSLDESKNTDTGGREQEKEVPQKEPTRKNRQNILFAAVIAIVAIIISAVLLINLDIIPLPSESTTAPATTTGASDTTSSVPSESTTAPSESEPVVTTTAAPESKFEMTQALMDEIVNELEVSARTELSAFFAEDCGLEPVVLFSKTGAANGELPTNYVLVLKEAPESVDDLYAYIDYGTLHIAVNLADKGKDSTMKLAFQIFEKLVATVEYPEGIQFHARLNNDEPPVDLVYTFQRLGIEDWYLHVESWISGGSTNDYQKTNGLKYQPTVVVVGEGWSIAYIPGDIYKDPAEQEKLLEQYEMHQSMSTGWALYLIEDPETTAEPAQP